MKLLNRKGLPINEMKTMWLQFVQVKNNENQKCLKQRFLFQFQQTNSKLKFHIDFDESFERF